ncbi:glycosyl hydrolase family 18 protein [Oscillibacter valericigenes]|uniref:glycosyl hydrolase family 18 protein n=1 Tax=Oscillibacter valericigenes TaxID=351091 RepID=UPI00195857B3|nr:glycosyl hydrolase family 18 protein [Oscillibacter valericigenes]MBM6909560.1 S-layer homology domain-containing protein [Oscillibacter valericigenes]
MQDLIRRTAAALAAACMAALLLGTPTGAEQRTYQAGGEVVGYYAGWAAYQGYTPDQLPAEHLTQINYAFARIDPDTLTIALENPAHDKKNLAALRKLRQQNGHLKLLISVGGWSDSQHFSDAAATAARREAFAASCVDFVVEQGLDGVDLDWEYPVSGGAPGTIHRPADKQNFTKLLQELRTRLDRQGRRDGKDYSLTIAGAAGSWYLNQIEAVKVADLVDHIFLMGYDLHGPWDTSADFNAPLYTPSGASPQGKSSIADSVQAYLDKGIPAEKLVLGMPLYGYAYQGVSSQNNGLYSTYTSAKSVSYRTLKKNYLSNDAYRRLRHGEAQVPYLYGSRTFISYDDAESLAAKAALARSRDLGGIGFWELSQDDGGELTAAASSAFRSTWGNPFRDVAPGAWYEEAVRYVYEAGLMQGTTGTTFSPGRTSNRGQIAAILHRLEGSPRAGTPPFTDVAADSYCADAVAWAEKNNIVRGFEDGTFRPEGRITRQQLAAILFRYLEHRGADTAGRADLSRFSDTAAVADYAREAMAWAVSAGLLQGRSDGTLDPAGSATRAQTAVILQRLGALLEEA